MGTPSSFTSVIELRLCEIRCSTYSSRGVGVETLPEPSAATMWYRRVVSNAAATWATSTSKYASAHAPAAIDGTTIEPSDPARRLMCGLAESQVQVALTLVVATLLQIRAPTGKCFGPLAGSLLSRPMTFQVIGVTVSAAWARAGVSSAKPSAPSVAMRLFFMGRDISWDLSKQRGFSQALRKMRAIGDGRRPR